MKRILFIISLIFFLASASFAADVHWIEKTPMPVTVTSFGYAVVNGNIYIIGGDNISGSSSTTVQRYTPATDTWEVDTNNGGTLAPLPQPRSVLYCGVINRKIHAIGGWEHGTYKGDHFIYDPESNTWSTGPSIPQYPIGQFAATVNNKIYVFGGWWGTYKDYVLEYSDAESWCSKSPMPTARNHGTTAVYNGKIYVIGGQDGQPAQQQPLDVVEMYDPETDTWTTSLAPMPSPQHWLGSSGSPVSNGIIYVTAGDIVYAYDPQADSWETLNSMPDSACGIAAINESIYAIGSEHTFQGVPSISKGLVAYWSFDNSDATDDSGNGHNGTIYGNPKCVKGVSGRAYRFDGIDDYIEVPDSNSLDILKEISITGWVNVNSYTDEWLGIVNKANSDGNDTFEICIHASKYLHFPLNFQSSGRSCYNSDPGSFNEGEWHFFGAVYDGTHVRIYIDGILTNSYTSVDEPLNINDHNLIIGAEKETFNGPHHFNGILDEIRIYNRALSESEIKELCAQAHPWSMFHHDPEHTGRSANIGPQDDTVLWAYDGMFDEVNSSPAIDKSGTIYVGSEDYKLYALNADGTLKWTYATGGGIKSSPAIGYDGTIYVGSRDHNLYAIKPDGILKWLYPTGGEISAPATIGHDGTIYVGSHDRKLYALNPDGTLKCEYNAGGVIASSPAIGLDGIIYVGSSNGRLNALYPNCTLKWESDPPIHGIWTHPALSPDGTVVYFGADDGYFYALNTSDGSVKWKSPYTYGGVRSSPAIGSDGTVYVGTQYGNLWAINPEDGSLKWDYYMTLSTSSSPAVGTDGTIYFATCYGHVFAMNEDGTEKWIYGGNFDNDGHFYSSPAIGSNGDMYIGSTKGKLYAFGKPLCEADFDKDGDVDGSDLAVFATGGGDTSLEELAAEFGRTNCLNW